MSVNAENIIPRKQAEATQTVQYIAPSGVTIIDKFTVTNTSASTVLFSCNLPANGEAVDDDNLVLDARQILSGETYTCPELVGQSIKTGGQISTLAGSASTLTISATGREIS